MQRLHEISFLKFAVMKKIFVKTYAVGMHHWGNRVLPLGTNLFCKWEPDNCKDINAVAIFEDRSCRRRMGYLRREDSAKIALLFKNNIIKSDFCVLKAHQPPNKFNKFKGPMQLCTIEFQCDDRELESVRSIMQGCNVAIEKAI